MAVSIPSDLVLDVMRNADPVRKAAAEAKLKSASDRHESQFAGIVERLDRLPEKGLPEGISPVSGNDKRDPTFGSFERMVLRNLFETLLPDEESGSFGTGPAAGVWRSMAADQLAGAYSEAGGIGIAEVLSRQSNSAGLRRESQWPYFGMQKIWSFLG